MCRIFTISLAALLTVGTFASAQVFVRVPFVRVYVDGPVWHVRAPFVNIGSPDYYVPGLVFIPASKEASQSLATNATPTLEEFARTFKASPGLHEATLINPMTGSPTTVQFTLPEGTMRGAWLTPNSILFDYGPQRHVRIEFDRAGATVISR